MIHKVKVLCERANDTRVYRTFLIEAPTWGLAWTYAERVADETAEVVGCGDERWVSFQAVESATVKLPMEVPVAPKKLDGLGFEPRSPSLVR